MARPRTPIETIPHGLKRYRAGCKCEVCRAANAARVRLSRRVAAWEEKEKRAVTEIVQMPAPDAPVATIDMDAPPGMIEQAVVEDLDELVGEPPWKRTAAAILRLNARVIDQAPSRDRLDLLSPMQLRTQEWMKLLRSVGPTDGTVASGAEALLAAMAGADDGGAR